MKKIIVVLALSACTLTVNAQTQKSTSGQKVEAIRVKIGDQEYVLNPIGKSAPTKKVAQKVSVKPIVRLDTGQVKIDTVKKVSNQSPSTFSAKYANGNVIVHGTVNGNITVNIVTNPKDSVPYVSVFSDSTKKPAPSKPSSTLTVVKTRAYQVFLDSRKDERVRPNQYVYRDYESTNSFRKLRKRLKKALYPVEKAGSASEFLLTEAGQTLLKKERGVHNIINVRNAGIIDMYIKGDTLIADFHSERYSATDSTGKMRIFYRK